MMKELGYSFTVYTAWIRGAGNLRVSQILHFCDTFGYDLFSFIVDGNIIPEYENADEGPQEELEDLISKCKRLESKNECLSNQNIILETERDALSKECEELKVQKSELIYEIRRLKDYIEHMEKGFPGIVAEK